MELLKDLNYKNATIEECFVLYHSHKNACICDADKKIILVVEE